MLFSESIKTALDSIKSNATRSFLTALAIIIGIASVIAMLIAELIDTYVYQKWVIRYGYKFQWGRVLSSNTISSPIDSLVFSFVAFYGLIPIEVVWSIFLSMVGIKLISSLVSIPLIYSIKPNLEWTLEGQT